VIMQRGVQQFSVMRSVAKSKRNVSQFARRNVAKEICSKRRPKRENSVRSRAIIK
jgi:hypothetical protein